MAAPQLPYCFDGNEFRRDRRDLRKRIYLMPDFPFLFWEHSIVRNIAIILRLPVKSLVDTGDELSGDG